MRIGLFTDTYLPDINGVVSSIETLRKSLVDLGNEVYVVCTKPTLEFANKEGNVIRLGGIEFKKLYGYAITQPIHMHALKMIEELHLDIIHAHTEFGVGIFARMVALNLNIPLVATYHTFYEDYTHYINVLNIEALEKPLKKTAIAFSRLFGNYCQQLIVPTLKTKERLLEYGVTSKMTVIPTGLDLEAFADKDKIESPFKNNNFMIIYTGRLAEEKRIELIVEAVNILAKRNINVNMLIVGDGPQKKELASLIDEYQLNEQIKFAGRIDHDIIVKYYNLADCFVSASLSETQGMTFIEAMACYKPVLAADKIALNNVLIDGQNGYYFTDENDLADMIVKIMNLNHEQLHDMKHAARAIANEYSLQAFGKRVLGVYQDAIDSYHSSHVIEKIKVSDENVKLYITSTGSTTTYNISLEDYLKLGYQKNQGIDDDKLEYIRHLHFVNFGYNKCLKKLTNADHSQKEMLDLLKPIVELSDEDKKEIISSLKQRGYLSDEAVIDSQIYVDQAKLLGKKKTTFNLVKRGIDREKIDEILADVSLENEIERGLQKAKLVLKSIKNKSYKETLQKIKTRLLTDGFDNIEDIISRLSLEKDDELERETIEKIQQIVHQKYSKKYSGKKLYQVEYRYLLSKGYDNDLIKETLDKTEVKNED